MFIPAEVFIKNDIQVIKLSSTLYSRPIYTDWKLIYLRKLLQCPKKHCLSLSYVNKINKLFERIVYNRFIVYLNDLHSTVTALLEATDNWALNIDQSDVNAVVFLDLKKAFDTVNHEILLRKLWHYGVRDLMHDWLLQWTFRKMVCEWLIITVSSFTVWHTPEDFFGPLLFLIFISDLPNYQSYSIPRMYADDTSLTFTNGDMNELNK